MARTVLGSEEARRAKGADPRQAVTDSVGRVHGTPGLWVGDASLFPSSCKVNPQITIMALATRLAERLAVEP